MKFYFKKHSIPQWTVKNIKEYNPLTDCIKRKIHFKNVISQWTLLRVQYITSSYIWQIIGDHFFFTPLQEKIF